MCGESEQGFEGLIERCRLFAGMTASERRNLLARLAYSVRSYREDARIADRGDVYNSLLVLLEGTVAAEMMDYSGKTLKVESIRAPGILASAVLFAPESRLPVTIVARSAVSLLVLPRRGVLEACRRSSAFLTALLEDMGGRTTFLAEKLRLTQFSTLRQKVAAFLLDRAHRAGSSVFTLPQTRQSLSEVFGVARPSLSRTLSALAREGSIEIRGRSVRLLDRSALERMVRQLDEDGSSIRPPL